MEMKPLLSHETSPKCISRTSRNKQDHFLHFPTIEKCKSIGKISANYSQKALDKNFHRSSTLSIKQEAAEILGGLKDTADKGLRIKLAWKALEILTIQSGIFNKELTVICKELLPAIYCDKSMLTKEAKDWIYESYDSLAVDLNNIVPYVILNEYWRANIEESVSSMNQLSYQVLHLQKEIISKSEEITCLNHELECSKQTPEHSTKLSQRETPINKESYEIQIKELNRIIDDLYSKLNFKEKMLKIKEDALKEKENEFKILQESKKKYLNYYQESKNEIRKLKDYIEKQNEKISELKNKNLKLDEMLTESINPSSEQSPKGLECFSNFSPQVENFELLPQQSNHLSESLTKLNLQEFNAKKPKAKKLKTISPAKKKRVISFKKLS